MTSLRKLNLDLNELTCLPPELSYCTNLKDLKLEGNAIKSPPREVRPTHLVDFILSDNTKEFALHVASIISLVPRRRNSRRMGANDCTARFS